VLRISVAGYHEHFVRKARGAQRRHLSDDALLVHIKAIHAETRYSYGWPRICKELLARGIRVGKDRVQKLMQRHGIRAKGKRRYKVTTDSGHNLPISPNLLERAALEKQVPSQGRNPGVAALVQPHSAALGAGLRQPDAVRAKLACQSVKTSQLMNSTMGYGFQGQGQNFAISVH